MELNVPTIAQRKAARRSQVIGTDQSLKESTPSASVESHSEFDHSQMGQQSHTSEMQNQTQPEISSSAYTQNATEALSTAPRTVTETLKNEPSFPQTAEMKLDKETLMAIARSMGLELKTAKKIWIKHSYSVTPESKQKFPDYCEVLGVKMQDGLEEALQDWFYKKSAEFEAVHKAKKND